jgi:itaconate CoA-transferase
VTNREALRTLIVEAFSTLNAEQVLERIEDAQIANAQVNDMAGLWRHEQLKARSRWREVPSPSGPLPALLPPGSWDDGDPVMNAVPALGQHSDAILAELGVDAAGIAALRAAEAT